MHVEENTASRGNLYNRLITLWVSEGVAGGIVHGLHFPFSGMFLSVFAVLCICLIGYYAGDKMVATKLSISRKLITNWCDLKSDNYCVYF